MKKFLFLFLGLFILSFLTGCGEYTTELIQFGQFSFDLRTNDVVYEKTLGEDFESNILGEIISSIYIEKTEIIDDIPVDSDAEISNIPYYNSLILSNVIVSKDVSLESFVQLNIDGVSSFPVYSSLDQENILFDCNSIEIDGVLEQFQSIFVDEKIVYFSQYFFLYEGKVYIISFSSEEEDERDDFVSSLKTLKCK